MRSIWASLRPIIAVVLIVAAVSADTPPPGTETAAIASLRFRRLLVPDELIPTRFPDYRPMKRDVFEAEIARINARASRHSQSNARIIRAVYRARLAGKDRLSGDAVLDVARTTREPAMLSLSPCNVSLGNLRWQGEPQGVIPLGAIANGEFQALVDRDGPLLFPWSARATSVENGVHKFALSLPRCATSKLSLELPPDVIPKSDTAMIVARSDPADSAPTSPDAAAVPFTQWELELGGHSEFTLQLETRTSTARNAVKPLMRESVRYRLTSSGLELRATFHLAAEQSKIDRLFLQATPGLHIASAQVGDRVLSLVSPSGDQNTDLVQAVLDEPLVGSDQELLVVAFAPLVVGRPWNLPTVRPTEVTWQEGQAIVEVLEPLLLAALRAHEGVENKVEPLAAPEQGESRQFQFWRPDGRLEVQLAYPSRDVSADVGTAIRISELAATGRMVVDVKARQGTSFTLNGMVAPGWTIDSVQSDPTDILESFSTAGSGARQDLTIRLRHAIPQDQKWRMIIRAHRRTPRLDQPLRGDIVRIVQFKDVQVRSSLVSLSADPPLHMTLSGDEHLQRLDPQSLTGNAAELVTAAEDGLLFYDQPVPREWSVTVSRERPRFSVQLSLAAEVDTTQLVESFELRCEPSQSYVSKLMVHLSRHDPIPLEWTLVDAGENRLSTRRIESTAEGISGEAWEISLSRPLNRPFFLRASRRQPLDQSAELSFMSLPEAASQSGTLRVHSIGGSPLRVSTRNLQPIPTANLDAGQLPTLRGAYRYAPSQEVAATIMRAKMPVPLSPAWLWLSQTESRWDSHGELEHETRLLIENTGLSSVSVELPPNAILGRVAVDHTVLPNLAVIARRIRIALPKDRRYPLVSVTYRTSHEPFRWAVAVRPQPLHCELPCFVNRSRIWIPEGFAVVGNSPAGTVRPTWDERLFGLRLWRRDRRPFNAFEKSDWEQLWESVSVWHDAPRRTHTTRSVVPQSPDGTTWSGIAPSIGPEESACGWAAYDFPQGKSERLWVYQDGSTRALAWGLMLAATGVSASWRRMRGRAGLVCLLIFAALVLVMPMDLVGLARGLFLGTLLGIAWRFSPRRSPASAPQSSINDRRSSVIRDPAIASMTTGAAMLLAVLWVDPANSQDPPAVPATTFNVLSPIDADQKEKGDYLFLPQSMYDILQRLGNETVAGASNSSWLESAEFHVTLAANEAEDSRLLPREFSMEYSLRSFHPATHFRVRCRRDRLRVLEITLDGQPSAAVWNEAGTELELFLEATGQHRVRIVTRPLQPLAELAGEFSATVPRSPRSRVIVHATNSLDRVMVPEANGALTRDDNNGELSADLFPLDELRVRWTAAAPKIVETPLNIDVSELFWLHVQADSLTVRGKFRFSARNGSIGQVAFLADRGLRLLPTGKDQPIASVDVVPGDRQLIRCWLDRPYEDVTLELSFAITGNSGLGNWQVPQIVAQGTRRTSAWLGITVTEGLLAEISADRPPAQLAPSAFLAAWEEAHDPPQQAFVLNTDSNRPQLAVRPVPPRIAIQEQQDVLVGAELASFRFEAVVTIDAGRMSQLRLLVPSGFEPREIIVLHDDANRLLRWSRVTDKELAIFLASNLSGDVRVMVQGEAAIPRANRSQVPLLAIANASSLHRTVNLFQEDDVRIELVGSPGLQAAASQSGQHSDWGRFVTSLGSGSTAIRQPALELAVRPNRPRVSGSMVTALSLSDDQWRLEATLQLDVAAGAIDEIRVILPEEVSGPIERSPPGEVRFQPATGEGGRLLSLPFTTPIEGQLKLTIAGDLTTASGDPIRVPELRVLDGVALKQFIVLPTRLQRQKAVWDISGLQSTELPEGFGTTSNQDVAVYQVIRPRMQAVLREVERLAGTPNVHLADYQLHWSADRQVHGIATFYLEPSRLAELELVMPDRVRPVHFHVAGLPATARAVGKNHWRVPLGPELLPQLVEVVFAGDLRDNPQVGGEVVFQAPVVVDVPVAETMWTVQGPPGSNAGQPTLIHTLADARHLDSFRKQTAESLLRRGLTHASQANPSDRDAWRADWDARIRQINQRLAERSRTVNDPTALARIGLPTDLATHWSAEAERDEAKVHCLLRGESARLSIQYRHQTRQLWLTRCASLLLLLLVGGCGLWFVRRDWVPELWVRSPQLFVAGFGVAWWLLCTPSVLGLAVLVLSAASALRPRWKAVESRG